MIFLDHWRTTFIALVEQEGLVPQGQHTHSLLLLMLGLRRTLLTFLRRLARRSVLNWQKWDVVLLPLQVTEVFETVEGVMAATGNGARRLGAIEGKSSKCCVSFQS